MAQTNYTPIILYNSGTTTNVPSASNLASGELAINYTDGKLFYKDNSSAIQVIGWKTTPTTAGGTGLTSYTAGDLPYYSSGSALSKLGIGTSGYVLESNGSAPTWVAQSTLSVGTATNANNVATTDNTSSSSTYYPTLVSATSGNNPITTSSTKLSFVPSTGVLTTTGHNLTGLTASSAVATDASKNLVSVTNTGTGNNVLATSPTITTPTISGNLTFTGTNPGIIFNNSNSLTNSNLNDYEIGSWTPADNSGSGLSLTINSATYTKIGNLVTVFAYITYPTTSSTNNASFSGLPFTVATNNYGIGSLNTTALTTSLVRALSGGTTVDIRTINGNAQVLNSVFSTASVLFTLQYHATF